MTFHIQALNAAHRLFDSKRFVDLDAVNRACDALQAELRLSDEFATVDMIHDSVSNRIDLICDRASEALAEFEGQDERLYVTYGFTAGEPLKYIGSRAEGGASPA